MPRAIFGTSNTPHLFLTQQAAQTDDARPGVLIECDPLIKSGIVEIDKKRNDIIVEDIDDEHLVIKENMVDYLKAQLDVKFAHVEVGDARKRKGKGAEDYR
ncbi:hypothetical protein RB596_002045 [Gaeumannomyces avenae]